MQLFSQKISDEFNLKKQADDLGVKVWQTPSFLFIMMGLVIIVAMTIVDIISSYYDSPEVLIISESSVVAILFTIGNLIIRTVEEIARSNKMKSEFVSVASHQLKTPIAELNWQIELLLSKFASGLNERQVDLVKGMAHSSEKMGRLANDLLDVAHIEQGQLAMNKEKCDICAIVNDAIEAQKVMALAANVELIQTCPVEPIHVLVDKKRIAVAFDNLLSNAIKYIDEKGKVEIIMRKDGDNVEVCVKDNGVGIPRAEQSKIAQKFFRSNNSIKNKTDGTGLGLYIAKNIVEQSGGTLWFTSIEGAGSEFYFTLPIVKE